MSDTAETTAQAETTKTTTLGLTEERLDFVICYSKLEDVVAANPTEKIIVTGICKATMIYLEGAPVLETAENAELYWFLVAAMTLHAYDHRDEVGFVPAGVRPILNQLKLQTDYADDK